MAGIRSTSKPAGSASSSSERRLAFCVSRANDAGVLSATIAEMDFPLAKPVADALRAAIDRHDLARAGKPRPRR
jgi:bifunctional pyridoxal-dependent enzyme with beta-cystathionase and maltose regulon repressor activities